MENNTTRRALLKAAPIAAAAVAIPGAAFAASTPAIEEDRYSLEEYAAGRQSAEEIAYLHMARAWMDRWKALGGDVSLTFGSDTHAPRVGRSMLVALDYWQPTDTGREDIPPHTWLTEERQHEGAVKALEGLLELVPGLREAVRDLARQEAYGRWLSEREA
ncbi:hypothetical protein [Altererythrobacter sp. Root672]|uniref:hypothetical protein n=1 Tax=Altererythrobacter sp. Root672 TaxID=1736584 RepID=UPI0006FE1C37|nr:hypothetical protein [Altererythrobacter sp. Root672]KRA80306.1 hypothetical protein ASD76_14075 [Altererythrobacter sp. Root672]